MFPGWPAGLREVLAGVAFDSVLDYDVDQLRRAVWALERAVPGVAAQQGTSIDFRILIYPGRGGRAARSTRDWLDPGHVSLAVRLPLGRDAGGPPRYGRVFSAGRYPRAGAGPVPAESVRRDITLSELGRVIAFVGGVQRREEPDSPSGDWEWFVDRLAGQAFPGWRPRRLPRDRVPGPSSPNGRQEAAGPVPGPPGTSRSRWRLRWGRSSGIAWRARPACCGRVRWLRWLCGRRGLVPSGRPCLMFCGPSLLSRAGSGSCRMPGVEGGQRWTVLPLRPGSASCWGSAARPS